MRDPLATLRDSSGVALAPSPRGEALLGVTPEDSADATA